MLAILFKVISVIPGLAEKFLNWQIQRANVELEGFRVGANVDLEAFRAHLQAQVDNNRLKLAQNSWWGAKLIIIMAGVPAALHFALVILDSSCPASWGWNIVNDTTVAGCGFKFAKLPAPYDMYQWAIVQSFFLVMPVQTGVNALAQWLNRRR